MGLEVVTTLKRPTVWAGVGERWDEAVTFGRHVVWPDVSSNVQKLLAAISSFLKEEKQLTMFTSWGNNATFGGSLSYERRMRSSATWWGWLSLCYSSAHRVLLVTHVKTSHLTSTQLLLVMPLFDCGPLCGKRFLNHPYICSCKISLATRGADVLHMTQMTRMTCIHVFYWVTFSGTINL